MAYFYGTSGGDIITYFEVSPGVRSNPANAGTTIGTDVIYGYGGDDRLDGYLGNDHLEGGEGQDVLDGYFGDDYLAGDQGNDSLYGFEGHDYLNGGSGFDRMEGGSGDDGYLVDSAEDIVREVEDAGFDYVDCYAADHTLAANVEDLRLRGNAAQSGSGNGLANGIDGNGFVNVLRGLGGDDSIYGAGGGDTLLGGEGHDALFGGDGNDVLRGMAGNETILGMRGADLLIGGAGLDRFVFQYITDSAPGQRDIIRAGDGATAFQGAGAAVGDKIDVSMIDAIGGSLKDDRFILGGIGEGRLSLVNAGTNTVVRGNIDADAAFELEIVIEDGAVLAGAYRPADFVL